jgi:putative transcriptional regulator
MTITHHLDDATLVSFAAGGLSDALSAVAAAHIALCPRCRRELANAERVGAVLLAGLAPAPLTGGPPKPPAGTAKDDTVAAATPGELPPALRTRYGDLDGVRWRWIGPGIWHRPLPVSGEGSLHLLKAAAGAVVPEHDHGGGELTLVLRGALIDTTGRYGPGDVADLDVEAEGHQPRADAADGCICLLASERPARFRGLLARLLQPYHGL